VGEKGRKEMELGFGAAVLMLEGAIPAVGTPINGAELSAAACAEQAGVGTTLSRPRPRLSSHT
jgi:hypothetical protein